MLLYLTIALIIAISSPILFLVYLELSSPPPPITTSTTLKDREAIVLKEVKPENISGKVKIIKTSQIWSATAEEKIEEGTKVKIKEVEGVHLKVEKRLELEEMDSRETSVEFTQPIEEEMSIESEERTVNETEEGLMEFDKDITEFDGCPNCETVITIPLDECPVCGKELEKEEEEKKGFFRSFNELVSSFRG